MKPINLTMFGVLCWILGYIIGGYAGPRIFFCMMSGFGIAIVSIILAKEN